MIYCFIGCTLSGKTTLSKRYAYDNGIYHFSTGDYFRAISINDKEKSVHENGISIKYHQAINNKVVNLIETYNDIIIDGFPRTIDQFNILHNLYENLGITIIYISSNPVHLYNRCINRNRDEYDSMEFINKKVHNMLQLLNNLKKSIDIIQIDNNSDIDTAYKGLCKCLEIS